MRNSAPAIAFGYLNQQGVELIEGRGVGGQVPVQELLSGFVARANPEELVTLEDAARVSIRDKHWLPSGIEQNSICGLEAKPFKSEKLPTTIIHGQGEQRIKRAPEAPIEPPPQNREWHAPSGGRPHRPHTHNSKSTREAWRSPRHVSRRARRRFFKARVAFRQLVFCVSIAPHDYFQSRPGRPPTLRSESLDEGPIVLAETIALSGGCAREVHIPRTYTPPTSLSRHRAEQEIGPSVHRAFGYVKGRVIQ